MISQSDTFGEGIAVPLRLPSQIGTITARHLRTLQDLIEAVETDRPEQHVGMLRTTAAHIANYIGVPSVALDIEVVEQAITGFSQYLTTRRMSRNSIRSYRFFAHLLLRLAKELGWTARTTEAATEWSEVLSTMPLPPGCTGIPRYAIATGKTPRQLTDEDLETWARLMTERGRGHDYVTQRIWHFRRAIALTGNRKTFPLISEIPKRSTWGIPINQMPEGLRSEVHELLKWKQVAFAPGRPRRAKLRPVSANVLAGCISRLYGYAVTVMGCENIRNLMDLVTEPIVGSYIGWAINDKHVTSISLNSFGLLLAAIRHHPHYKKLNLDWFVQLMAQIPQDPESRRQARKQRKYLPHAKLSEIPIMISEQRRREKRGTKLYARMLHDELIVKWLLILPWRQRNIREARLGPPETGNIFKSSFSSLLNIARPRWVEAELAQNPNATAWQVFFRRDETKSGQEVRGVIPKQLIPLLEEYLSDCRPMLVGERDPNTLFLNRIGGRLLDREVTSLIGNLTARYAGRRVTPHLFRDSFAHRWLDEHPEDYLTLSKILWHRNIKTTIQIYGRNFDESHGIRKAEEWLEKHECSS